MLQTVLLPFRGTETGWASSNKPHEFHQQEIAILVLGKEQPQAQVQAEGQPDGRQFCREGPARVFPVG